MSLEVVKVSVMTATVLRFSNKLDKIGFAVQILWGSFKEIGITCYV